jgi:hypothetical protein
MEMSARLRRLRDPLARGDVAQRVSRQRIGPHAGATLADMNLLKE